MTSISEEFTRSRYLKNIPTKTPHVESAGTNNGFISFCEGVGQEYPDIVSASRPIKESELDICKNNGVNGIEEIKIGYDGIIVGNYINSPKLAISEGQLFLALSEKVYDKKTGKMIKNPYQKWSDIDHTLPNDNILIYGPPATSGTRDVFVDMLMKGCMKDHHFINAYPNYKTRQKHCTKIREDGLFVESGENDNLIVQNLKNNPHSFGILGFNFLETNKNIIQAATLNNVEPTFKTISSKQYSLSRPLFLYLKKEHLALTPQIKDFIEEVINPETIGKDGYLIYSGLVPLNVTELKEVREKILSQL